MFDVVRGRSREATELRPALVISLATHAVILAVALLLSQPVAPPPPEHTIPVHVPRAHLTSGPATAVAPSTPSSQALRPKRIRPAEQHPLARRTDPAPAAATSERVATGSDDSRGPGGEPGNGPGSEGPACATPPCGDGAGVFSEDVVAALPVLLSAPEVTLGADARRMGVGGTMLVRCVITAAGTVEGCEVLRGVPLAEAAVLAALRARQYRPAQVDGRPVSVRHLFTVNLGQGR